MGRREGKEEEEGGEKKRTKEFRLKRDRKNANLNGRNVFFPLFRSTYEFLSLFFFLFFVQIIISITFSLESSVFDTR